MVDEPPMIPAQLSDRLYQGALRLGCLRENARMQGE
jgi:hypothetical protein